MARSNSAPASRHHARRRSNRCMPPIDSHISVKFGSPSATALEELAAARDLIVEDRHHLAPRTLVRGRRCRRRAGDGCGRSARPQPKRLLDSSSIGHAHAGEAGEIVDRTARSGEVEVEQRHRLAVAEHHVLEAHIVVAHDRAAPQVGHLVAPAVRPARFERGRRIVEPPDQPSDRLERLVGLRPVRVWHERDVALDEARGAHARPRRCRPAPTRRRTRRRRGAGGTGERSPSAAFEGRRTCFPCRVTEPAFATPPFSTISPSTPASLAGRPSVSRWVRRSRHPANSPDGP